MILRSLCFFFRTFLCKFCFLSILFFFFLSCCFFCLGFLGSFFLCCFCFFSSALAFLSSAFFASASSLAAFASSAACASSSSVGSGSHSSVNKWNTLDNTPGFFSFDSSTAVSSVLLSLLFLLSLGAFFFAFLMPFFFLPMEDSSCEAMASTFTFQVLARILGWTVLPALPLCFHHLPSDLTIP